MHGFKVHDLALCSFSRQDLLMMNFKTHVLWDQIFSAIGDVKVCHLFVINVYFVISVCESFSQKSDSSKISSRSLKSVCIVASSSSVDGCLCL